MEKLEKKFNIENNNKSETKESAIQRVINLSEKEEQNALEMAREIFLAPEKLPIEREKTEKETQIIQDLLAKLPEFLGEYEIEPLSLTLDHIHVVNTDLLSKKKRRDSGMSEKCDGVYMENRQGIIVLDSDDDLTFAERLAHECLHANSFTSFTAQNNEFKLRRIGLTVIDKEGKRYFNCLNEAITEELTKKFDKEYFNQMPSLSDATKERQKFIDLIKSENPNANTDEIKSVKTIQKPNGMWQTIISEYVDKSGRKHLLSLVNEIYEQNKTKFTSPKDVFQLFAKAIFTGQLLEISRLIEDTFGKDSLRQLAEKTAT